MSEDRASFFLVVGYDRPGSRAEYEAALSAHRERLSAPPDGIAICIGGPLVAEDGTHAGSAFVIEAADLAAARNFAEADPYLAGNVWDRMDVTRFDWRRGRP